MFKRTNIAISIILLAAFLILPGCTKSPASFYKKVCKRSFSMQEKLEDFYGYELTGSEIGFYDDVDECVEKSVETEQDLYEECLDEKGNDEEDCQEMIDKLREEISKYVTRDGCEDLYGYKCVAIKPTAETKKYASSAEIAQMEEEYEECMEEVEELCEDLPEKF